MGSSVALRRSGYWKLFTMRLFGLKRRLKHGFISMTYIHESIRKLLYSFDSLPKIRLQGMLYTYTYTLLMLPKWAFQLNRIKNTNLYKLIKNVSTIIL